MIDERINALRAEMKRRGIDVYIVPTADFHNSEYVGEYFKARKFLTGFTGSSGTAVFTQSEANLWTDGRYFLQAADQLKGSSVILRKMGEEGVPLLKDYVRNVLPEKGCIGFDGRVVTASDGETYEAIAAGKNGRVYEKEDLADLIWTDRPAMSCTKAWIREKEYSGCDTSDKLAAIRKAMCEQDCDLQLVTCLYDIAWILNLRADDISYVPVILSYLAIRKEDCILFVQEEAITEKVREYLTENRVQIRPYNDFYDYAAQVPGGGKIWLDKSVTNYRIFKNLPGACTVFNQVLPSVQMRACKNETEMKNARIAHEKDAVAMITFMHWLKQNVGKIPMTEISASDYLASLRAKQEGFIELSFSTIAGYADHGAIVHYSATPETDREIKPESFFLVDSGGHYMEGTTDITRTFALGPATEEMKADYTRVLRAKLNLADTKFKYGATGQNLDMIARAPFWEIGMDYNHGTGHGVGDLLNVHEGPQGTRWNLRPGDKSAPFEEGMITSDEPGMYLEGKYGIRIEDELLCRKGEKNSYGQFMYFEDLTYVPVDLDAVAPEHMNEDERRRLNQYHEQVYKKMAPHFEGEMKEWLRQATRAI